MPNKKLKDSQELALLQHPKMDRYHGMRSKIKKGQKVVEESAPFSSYFNLIFNRTDQRKKVKFKGHTYDAVVFEFDKIIQR